MYGKEWLEHLENQAAYDDIKGAMDEAESRHESRAVDYARRRIAAQLPQPTVLRLAPDPGQYFVPGQTLLALEQQQRAMRNAEICSSLGGLGSLLP